MERLVESTEVLFELVFAGAGGTIDERAREDLEGFFCNDEGGWPGRERDDVDGFFCSEGGVWAGREREDSEGLLRSGSVDGV